MNKEEQDHQVLNETLQDPIDFVLGELFWVKKLASSEVIKKKDLQEFCVTNLEGLSPFGIEQLLWGKVVRGKEVLIYATIKDRVEALSENLENFLYVLPSFLIFNLQRGPESSAQAQFVQNHRSLSLLIWKESGDGNVLPDDILSTSLPEDASDVEIKLKQDELFQAAVRKGILLNDRKIPYRKALSHHVSLNKEVLFVTQSKVDGSTITEVLSKDKQISLWDADIRDDVFVKKLKGNVQIKNICWKTFLAALLMLFFLFGGQILKFFGEWSLESSNKQFKQQVPIVVELESKDFLVKKFERMLYQAHKPLERLTILNDVRPNNIYFTSVNIDSNQLSVAIEGVAENSTAISAYTESLNKHPLLKSHQFSNLHVSSHGTQFTLSCLFKDKIQVPVKQAVVLKEQPPITDKPKKSPEKAVKVEDKPKLAVEKPKTPLKK